MTGGVSTIQSTSTNGVETTPSLDTSPLAALGEATLPATIALRGVVIAAHPDDEVIGLGARLARWPDVWVVHVTDGAPRNMRAAADLGFTTRESYTAARRAERAHALELASIRADRTHDLDCVDQEASHNLVWLSAELAALIRAIAPDVVVTQPYEGGHPDHDATAFAVHAAIQLAARTGARAPAIVEMTSYHLGPAGIRTGRFLPYGRCAASQAASETQLDDAARAVKERMFACYASQCGVLSQFGTGAEPLRLAPRYDFTVPPHPGMLYYDHYPWGVTSAEWRALARDAMRTLALERTQGRVA